MSTSHTNQIVFGLPDPTLEYRPRRAVYAVVADEKGRVAAVLARHGYFLPGGGAWPGETLEQTIRREVMEELGRDVRVIRLVGEAVQYFSGEDGSYRMEAFFFAAEFTGEAKSVAEHELHWLEPAELDRLLYHQCHAWAARQCVIDR